MSKRKTSTPEMWLPQAEKQDACCTLLELWSRHYKQIAKLCGLASSTVDEYTTQLQIIAPALAEKPAGTMTCYAIWEAVRSKQAYKRCGELRCYSNSAYTKRMAAIHDIYLYCENASICCDVLFYPPWLLVFPTNQIDYTYDAADLEDAMEKEVASLPACRCLTIAQEQLLVQRILAHVTLCDEERTYYAKPPSARTLEETNEIYALQAQRGLWCGLAMLLYCGLRSNELRALRYSSFYRFRAPDRKHRRYIDFIHTVTDSGEDQDSMKTKNSVRRLPETCELQSIMLRAEEAMRQYLGCEDIGHMPIVCGRDLSVPCTSIQLMKFAKEQLVSVVRDGNGRRQLALMTYTEEEAVLEYDADDADSTQNDSADRSLTARAFRWNIATKLYAETAATDIIIRLWMGHVQDIGAMILAPYDEDNVWDMLLITDHRMILPEIHPGWCVELAQGTKLEITGVGKQFF